jgi:hypothetical protein
MRTVGEMGKLLVLAGLVLAAAGVLLIAAARLGWRRLPGTLVLSGRHVTFVFPILLCVVISLLLTLILSLWRR